MSNDDTKRPSEEDVLRYMRDADDRFFATRSAEDREVYKKAMTAASEIVGYWEDLFPALAIPRTAMTTLEEMIWREVWAAFTPDDPDPIMDAHGMAHDRLYRNNAIRAGLRHGEPLQGKPEELDEEAIPGPPMHDLPTPDTKH